jgi:uncharacterized membrane protein
MKANRAVFFIFFLLVIPTLVVYAQNSSSSVQGLESLGTVLKIIVGFFTSMYMKAILTIALGGLALGLIVNRGEPGVVKKFIPWVIACVLLLSLSGVTGLIFKPEGATQEVTGNYDPYKW